MTHRQRPIPRRLPASRGPVFCPLAFGSPAHRPHRGSLPIGLALGLLASLSPNDLWAAVCTVPSTAYSTIQRAVNDPLCSEVELKNQVYTEQVNINRPGGSVTLRGAGAGRTVIASPSRRTRSTVSTTFLRGYAYVVQVAPGSTVTLTDLTVDGGTSIRCGEPYFGLRAHNASLSLDGVVIDNVRGRPADFGCANIIAVAATAEGAGSARLSINRGTIRNFQQLAVLARGISADLSVKDTVIRGAGEQSQQVQIGIELRDGAKGQIQTSTVRDLRYTGDPCKGVGTGVRMSAAGISKLATSVLLNCDRGVELAKNTGVSDVVENRFVETLSGILAHDSGAGLSHIIGNGFSSTRRSTASTVAMCFDDSGDAIAVRNEKDSLVQRNSAADSARCAVELLTGTSNLDVSENQAVRSARTDIEDRGTSNRLSKNLCLNSTPTGLCSGSP